MKKIKLLSLVSTALVGLTQPVWAGPHGGGGGFAGGGHFGGGGHFAVAFAQHRLSLVAAHVLAAEVSADWLADPNSTMEAVGCLAVRSHGFTGSASRSINSYAGRRTTITHQPNRVGSIAGRSGVSNSKVSTGQPTIVHQEPCFYAS